MRNMNEVRSGSAEAGALEEIDSDKIFPTASQLARIIPGGIP